MTDGATVTELIAIRHGQTEWNLEGRHQGQMDSDLSVLGVRQALALARRLVKVPFHAIYSSDLLRALHTAEYIARKTGHSIRVDRRLRERHFGIFHGLTVAEIRVRYPNEYLQFRSGDPDYVIPDGESVRQKYDRVIQCARQIVQANLGRRVIVVTHGGVLDALFRFTVGLSLSIPRRFRLLNAGLNTFLIVNGAWTLGTWGDVGHLRDMEPQDEGGG